MSSAPHDEAARVAERDARRDAERDALRYSLFDAAALQAQQQRLRAMVALWRGHGWPSLAGRQLSKLAVAAAATCSTCCDWVPSRGC